MHITRYTDYSLRVLIYLAVKGDELATIKEIADSYQISKNHLMKIVQALNAKGYLTAIRGKNGGLKLKGTACDINVGELVREIEQDFVLVECFGDDNQCAISPACRLNRIFGQALEAFLETLDQYTLEDLVPPQKQRQIGQILNLYE